ncbi:MAG: glycosyltransferase [Bacteroidales bacterium]|nr:glycosyltransferase [Bacteroidales bacterium]
MKYSVIIPVYNRPDEARELLESLCAQTCRDFEVVIVEDGSAIPCKEVAEAYADRLDIHYYVKENGGPGRARNYGVERARGEYVLILDSDAVLPEGYIAAVEDELQREPADAFGGPDRAHPDFTPMQKAINYAMTSFFTTGGIRGGKKKLDKFYPRSFNMGVRREVYQALGGFSDMRFGEDIDFSTRIFKGGYRCRLFPEAWVWHKRRTDLKKFFKQVHNSGIARIHLSKRHPGTLKLVHLLPAVFTLGCALLLVLAAVAAALGCPHWWVMLLPLVLFALIIMADASRQERSVGVGLRAIAAAYVQLMGYGTGFLRSWWQRCVRGKGEFEAFKKNFYK